MKKVFLGLLILSAFLLVIAFSVKFWLQQNFDEIINNNPDRKYHLSYQSLNINADFSGLKLSHINIAPRNENQKFTIAGDAGEIQIKDIHWHDLFFDRKAVIEHMVFHQPEINIYLANDSVAQPSQQGMEFLLGDILERGKIKNFSIEDGRLNIYSKTKQLKIASVAAININVKGLKTDKKISNHIIPFKFEFMTFAFNQIESQMDSLTRLYCQNIDYNSAAKTITINQAKVYHDHSLLEVSKKVGIQKDVVQASAREIKIRDIFSASFTDEWIVNAGNMIVDSLQLVSYRNKNLPRAPDQEKPMFLSIIKAIPWQISVDTMQLKNSNLSYLEVPEDETDAAVISFDNFYASIYNFSTIQQEQKEKDKLEIDVLCQINNSGKMKARLTVPYNDNHFWFNASISDLDALNLNQVLNPLLSIDVKKMNWHHLQITMSANKRQSNNEMIFEYDDLKLSIKDDRNQHKKFKSLLTNMLVKSRNLASKKNYVQATYFTRRNPYRGPFNLMWNSLRDGMLEIVPTATAQKFVIKEKEGHLY